MITSVGAKGRITSSHDSQLVKIDGNAVDYTRSSAGSQSSPEINLVGDGVHKLEIGGRSTFLEVRRNPTLTVLLALERNVGTLVVETQPVDASVQLNGRPLGRTTISGVLRLPMDVGKYSVRVTKDGFRAPPTQNVELAKGDEKKLSFTLVPTSGTVAVINLPPGEQISIDGVAKGTAGPSLTPRIDGLSAGPHTLEATRDGYYPARLDFQIADGKTTTLDASKLALVAKATPPAPPDPVAIEARDWDRVRNSNSIDDLQNFLYQHSAGAHVEEARNRIDQLRQSQARDAQAKALRDQESAWHSVDTSQKVALQDFLTRYPNSSHAPDARSAIDAINRKESSDLVAQHDADLKARDQDGVKQTLARYQAAFSEMNITALQSVWVLTPAEVKRIKDQFKNAKTFHVTLYFAGPIIINSDSAAAECTRTVTVVPTTSSVPISHEDRVRVHIDPKRRNDLADSRHHATRTVTPFVGVSSVK